MHDHALWASRLGMKPAEIVDVTDVGDLTVVTTHDDIRTVIDTQGAMTFLRPGEALPESAQDEVPPEAPASATTPVTPAPPPDPAGADPAAGSVKEVLARVGDNADLALLTLAAEKSREQPRASLIRELEKIGDVDA